MHCICQPQPKRGVMNEAKLIKSPLRYPGGKSRALKFLSQFLPKDIDEFREPFFGGGSLGLYVAQNHSKAKIYANDLNYELFCFWQSLQRDCAGLISGILKLKNSFTEGKELYKFILSRRNDELDELTRGIDFFILNRITFSGVVDSGGYSQKSYESRFTPSSIERLETTSKILGNFAFFSSDYKEFLSEKSLCEESLCEEFLSKKSLGKSIENIPKVSNTNQGKNDDKKSDEKSVFLFLDPPYFSASKSKLYGKKGILHTTFNHCELCEVLKSTKHKFLLTYDDSAFIRDLYKDFCLKEWSLQYGMNNFKQTNAPKGKELLISNFDLAKSVAQNSLFSA